MIRVSAGVAAALFPLAAFAQAPDWCASDSLTLTERMICTDAILSRLDRELAAAYAEARRAEPDVDQSGWLAARESCEIRVSCLEEIYRNRIAELARIAGGPAGNGASPAEPWPEVVVESLPDAPKSPPLDHPVELPPEPSFSSEPNGPFAAAPPVTFPPDEEPSGQFSDEELARALARGSAGGSRAAREFSGARPWCDASRLNPSERTICADPDLRRLDAMLEEVYGRTTARNDDAAQLRWLRGERDACGTSRACIATAYVTRIEALLR